MTPIVSAAAQDPIGALLGDWATGVTLGSTLLRLALAFFLAASLGYERANKRHSAGLRTFILVSIGSATAMLLDLCLTDTVPIISGATTVGVAIISTYSILYSSRSQIKGLTTAVGLWACCILGLVLGAGLYTVGAVSFVGIYTCMCLLPPVEGYLKDRSNHFEIHLELKQRQDLQDFIATIRKLGLRIDDIESNPAYINSGLSVFSISLTITGEELKQYKTHSEIVTALSTLDYVSHIEEI
jgi:putative Mg2+ transporter-C (MgtC) family protein